MPLDQQAKLLSFYQNRSCTSVGSNQIDLVDARVISATNRDMDARIRSGLFRGSLLPNRDIRIHLPPLQASGDILPLVHHYPLGSPVASRFRSHPSRTARATAPTAQWPGNLRGWVLYSDDAGDSPRGFRAYAKLLARRHP